MISKNDPNPNPHQPAVDQSMTKLGRVNLRTVTHDKWTLIVSKSKNCLSVLEVAFLFIFLIIHISFLKTFQPASPKNSSDQELKPNPKTSGKILVPEAVGITVAVGFAIWLRGNTLHFDISLKSGILFAGLGLKFPDWLIEPTINYHVGVRLLFLWVFVYNAGKYRCEVMAVNIPLFFWVKK